MRLLACIRGTYAPNYIVNQVRAPGNIPSCALLVDIAKVGGRGGGGGGRVIGVSAIVYSNLTIKYAAFGNYSFPPRRNCCDAEGARFFFKVVLGVVAAVVSAPNLQAACPLCGHAPPGPTARPRPHPPLF